MKGLIKFVRTSIYGGIVFLIPIVIGVILLKKVFTGLLPIVEPVAQKIGFSGSRGRLMLEIILVLIILIFCFLAGLLIRSTKLQLQIPMINHIAALLIPGFEVMKAQSHEQIKKSAAQPWQSIFLKKEEGWCFAFIVEKTSDGMCSIFMPEIPKMDSGDVMIAHEKNLEMIHIDAKEAFAFIKAFGRGAATKMAAASS